MEENKNYIIWNKEYNEVIDFFGWDRTMFLNQSIYNKRIDEIINKFDIELGDRIYKIFDKCYDLENKIPKKIVYISGPITGVKGYEDNFKRAKEALELQGYCAINPAAINDIMPDNLNYEDYMKIDLAMLNACNAIYMLKGWEKSCGANREYGYALAKGYKIMFEHQIKLF